MIKSFCAVRNNNSKRDKVGPPTWTNYCAGLDFLVKKKIEKDLCCDCDT